MAAQCSCVFMFTNICVWHTFSGNLVMIKNELPEQQTPEGSMAEGENDGDVSFMGCTVDQDKQVR